MTLQTTWYIEGHITLTHFIGESTVDDLKQANQWALECTRAYPDRPVHHLVDATQQTRTAISASLMRDTMSVFKEPNYGWLVLIGINDVVSRMLVSIATQLFKINVHTVATMNEAVQFLQEIDPSLTTSKL